MIYPEEEFADDLYCALARELNSPTTTISKDGEGISWSCTVERDNSRCEIYLSRSVGARYYSSFIRNSSQAATSRISSKNDTIAAIGDWIAGLELAQIYDRYPFVDRIKRALTKIQKEALSHCPELKSDAETELEHQFGDFYDLHFRARDRRTQVSFYGQNELPDARFYWDECLLLQFQTEDHERMATVIKRWVCDNAMPSELRGEFPWFEIPELADYYERGNPIEGEFIRSWDFIERYYGEEWCDFKDTVLPMIRALRDAGYDRQLRAGQSMSTLGLSRSRRHGLGHGQACIWFQFRNPTMTVSAEFAGLTLEEHPIEFTHKLKALLDALVQCDID